MQPVRREKPIGPAFNLKTCKKKVLFPPVSDYFLKKRL